MTGPRHAAESRACIPIILGPRGDGATACPGSDVLVYQDRVAVGVDRDKTGGPRRGFVGLLHQLHARRFQPPLEFADVSEALERVRILIHRGLKIGMFVTNMP